MALAVALAGIAAPLPSAAQLVYPSQGQSAQQQATDERECREWAQAQTGVDPSAARPQVRGADDRGHVLSGAATGAALGAVGGAVGGSAGRGAKIGTAVGATAGLFNRMGSRREADRRQSRADAAHQAGQSEFQRAFGLCMTGRGYTVG